MGASVRVRNDPVGPFGLAVLCGVLTAFLGNTRTVAAEMDAPLFERVAAEARQLAEQPYRDGTDSQIPPMLEDLSAEAYQQIRFRKDQALWADKADFTVEFFHPGYLYRRTVVVHEVVNGEVRPITFSSSMFDYGANGDTIGAALPEHLGFAGFRLHYPVHRPDYKDEIASFLGAAYFRMVGRNQRYGMSMRGIAIDTASPSGEIFPRFTKFWLVKPAPDENRMRLLALLDSASLTGAFTFEIESRNATTIRVRSRLFARRDVGKLGVAPLTSMFAWGENRGREFDDYRPEVHDSDGLLQHTGSDEWIWRPLVNPPTLQVSELLDPASRGYGLIQRDRAFEHFQDPAARFEQRPGIWVTPGEGDWTRGAVQLVEIPSPNEENDNIAAFWVGAEPLRAGQTREFSYELRTVEGIDNPAGLATVVATRNGRAASAATPRRPPRSERTFTVDFAGGELTALTASQPVTAELAITRGRAAAVTVTRLPIGNTWRVSFRLRPADQQQLVNMRLFLTLRGRRVSETWNYLFSPESIAAR